MAAPVLIKPIPTQVINELAAYGPFDLKEFIQTPEGSEAARFEAETIEGNALPPGMICTSDGFLIGIPGKNSHGNYQINVSAQNKDGVLKAEFLLTIKPSLAGSRSDEYRDELKSQVWEALEKNLPIPDLSELYDRPATYDDVYYLLERWATLIIWDAFNLEPSGPKIELNLPTASPHYYVYDRGSSLVASPKDLYSHERTLEDALQTARAMAREVYKRGWTIEMAGFEKMTRAAWVELQHLGDKYGKQLEILNFDPSLKEIKIYTDESVNISKIRKNL